MFKSFLKIINPLYVTIKNIFQMMTTLKKKNLEK